MSHAAEPDLLAGGADPSRVQSRPRVEFAAYPGNGGSRSKVMAHMHGWEVAIWLVAAYLAVKSLVRLMRHRRDQLVAELQTQVVAERARKRAEKRRERQRQIREQQMIMHNVPGRTQR